MTLKLLVHILGQVYNLTGSSNYAVPGDDFTWTCEMFIPVGETINAVKFYRNSELVVVIGHESGKCLVKNPNPRYVYSCTSVSTYTLTITSEILTEFEQGSVWNCEYAGKETLRSSDMGLRIASKNVKYNYI